MTARTLAFGLFLLTGCSGATFEDDGSGASSGSGTSGSGGTSAGGASGASTGGAAGSGNGGAGTAGAAAGGAAGTGMGGGGGAGAGTGGGAGAGTGGAGTGGAAGASGTGGGGGGGVDGCAVITCEWDCCNGACVNKLNDIRNCGECGNECSGTTPFCDNGTCGLRPCQGIACIGTQNCCGTICCNLDEICCASPGPVGVDFSCQPGDPGICPQGCRLCGCAAVGTMVATPEGERRIELLGSGDLVFSVDDGRVVAVPLRAVKKFPVENHWVIRVELETGSVVEMSPIHPTSDGRLFSDLVVGGQLDGVPIVEVSEVAYPHAATHDVLPDSDTGSYFAGGVLVGSTLAPLAHPVLTPSHMLAPASGRGLRCD